MANVEWAIKGLGWSNCNCAYGCPCQFNALPTQGHCRAMGFSHIQQGHYGDTPLDGLNFASLWLWPGPVHQGNGTRQIVVDERANPAQRAALEAVAQGRDTEPGGFLQIFSTTISKSLETLYKPFDFEVSMAQRRARLSVPGVIESKGQPIKNPITGLDHRARINLPEGFEYREAEVISGTTKTQGGIALDLNGSHGYIFGFHWGTHGYIA